MDFANVYDDAARATAYASLEFPNTYYLAFRDLPEILRRHATGRAAFDFGCGTGRSTRFLRRNGFAAVGVDLSPAMIEQARRHDPAGDYRLVDETGPTAFPEASCDLALAAFTFDNVPGRDTKVRLLSALRRLLRPSGVLVNLVSSPDIYCHEWASFTTRDFPGNLEARSGDRVRIVMTDVPDHRPVEDILWAHEAYLECYAAAGLDLLAAHRPLGRADEPYPWVSETTISPWVIYVLRPAGAPAGGAAASGILAG
jgi:SAM-dependent methyltransferase